MDGGSIILIVDDEAIVRESLAQILAPEGYQLVFAASGPEALALARQVVPDLILLDVLMPGMDGLEICRLVREDPLLAPVPIVLVTAAGDLKGRVRGIQAGADDLIAKPFDPVELLAKARTVTRLSRYRRLLEERAQREQAEDQMAHQRRDLQRLSAQLMRAQEVEQAQLSRELHDELGQALTAISLNLAEVLSGLPPDLAPALGARLAETRALADQALDQVRGMALDLHPSILDDLGLAATLRWYLGRWSRTAGVAVEFEAVGLEQRLPSEVETALYRVFQEALTNVARHAGASRVSLRLERRDDVALGLIEDDGRGFELEAVIGHEQPPFGVGLLGMRERVALLDGRFEIATRPGEGTRLRLEIPLAGFLSGGEGA